MIDNDKSLQGPLMLTVLRGLRLAGLVLVAAFAIKAQPTIFITYSIPCVASTDWEPSGYVSCTGSAECQDDNGNPNGVDPYLHTYLHWYCDTDVYSTEVTVDEDGTRFFIYGDADAYAGPFNEFDAGQQVCDAEVVYDCDGDYSGDDNCIWDCN